MPGPRLNGASTPRLRIAKRPMASVRLLARPAYNPFRSGWAILENTAFGLAVMAAAVWVFLACLGRT